jgi:ribosomal protein RSM22 (predicted rRNA methylase)
MNLPEHITALIDELTDKERLSYSYASLSERYRHKADKRLEGQKEHLAYLACRLPATFASCSEVFWRLRQVMPAFAPSTLLDVGAGPGTVLLALAEQFASLKSAKLIERDAAFTELAKKLLSSYPLDLSWQDAIEGDDSFDLVCSSYMLSELSEGESESMVKTFIQKSKSLIVLVDTGTPLGYKSIIQARTILIDHGFTIVAPCPHNKPCPIVAPDWCHFSVRLPRSHLHRMVKGADRGFEDEKFCYLIAAKERVADQTQSRIVGAPIKRSGHVHVKLCTPEGTIAEPVISRKMAERYALAKKAEWGDLL